MFHFPTFPPRTLCIQVRVTGHDSCRVSPFGHPRITARLAAPRGLSQPPTSFIGSWCLGIHRAPLITWPQRCSRPLCSSQGTGRPSHTPPRHTHQGAVQRMTGPNQPHTTPGAQPARGAHTTRSLRTQQRAYDQPRTTSPFPHPQPTGAVLGKPDPTPTELASVPPMSNHSGLNIRTWPWTTQQAARRSLERR